MTGATVERYDVVIPTIGRPALSRLLSALAAQDRPVTGRVLVVDDRPAGSPPLPGPASGAGLDVHVLAGGAGGPGAARNVGWRAATAPWVAFLDDDVVPGPGWSRDLEADLAGCGPDVAASQGRISVPLPAGRRPTDWERNVAGLETASWATADMAYRRAALLRLGGFDERFPRAYREDADLALRALVGGFSLVRGRRQVSHPVLPAPWHVSVGKQAGNADDALMDELHGPGWRARAAAPAGAFRRHVAVTAAGVVALASALPIGRRGHLRAALTGGATAAWLSGTTAFALRRIVPGPRSAREVTVMALTSVAIPPVAAWHRVRGARRARGARPLPLRPEAVLFDRDGTLVHDVPYNGDPALVRPVAGAGRALDRLRGAGIPVGLVSNQSGVARGLLTMADVEAVNRRVDELLGPFDVVLVCPHGPDDGCDCRKPEPGMVRKAAAELGVRPERCALIGDIGADVGAALAAGARPVLVPTPVTRAEEVEGAPEVAPDLAAAVDLLLGPG